MRYVGCGAWLSKAEGGRNEVTQISTRNAHLGSKVRRSKAVVSHISRKTSEMWGTLSFVAEPMGLAIL
jgi:hypothetical protein